MHSLCAWPPALALVMFGLACGCGDDEVLPDAGSMVDGGGDASNGEDLCPGQLSFEAVVADAISGEPTFEFQVVEVGGTAMTTSAPNGRAQLCLPAGVDSSVRSTKSDYLTRLDTLSRDALAAANAAERPYPLEVLSIEDATALFADVVGGPRDPADSTLLVSVHAYPDGAALVGATIAIDAARDGAFARDASGEFLSAADGEVAAGGTVLFANVALTGGAEPGRATITVTPPASFSGTCVGPSSVELEVDGVSGAFFACQ